MLWESRENEPHNPPFAEPEQVAGWIGMIHRMPDVRMDKVRSARDAIRREVYENTATLHVTVERMYDEVGFG